MDSGNFVHVPQGIVNVPAAGYVGGEDIILQQFNSTSQIVTNMQDAVTGYMSDLNALITSAAMPPGWDAVLGTVVINPVTSIDPSSIPAPGDITLPDFGTINFPYLPTLTTPPTLDLNYVAPVAPADVNPDISYMMATYTSDMWLDLFTKVHADILTGGTGVSPAVEAAIYARSTERQRISNEKAQAAAVSDLASKALSFPQYAMLCLENQMAAEVLRQEHNSSNEIAISQATLAQDNTKFMVGQGVELEKILRSFYEMQEKLSLEAKKAVADLVLRTYAEKNQAFIAKWQGVSSEMRAKVDAINAVVAENQAVIEAFKAQTQGAISQIEMVSKERESLVSLAVAEVTVFKSKVEAQTAWYNALSENQKAQIAKSELELRKATEQLKATLQSQESINSLREKIAASLGGIAAQVMASAMNAVHTSVGHSTSKSSSVQESYGHTAHLSEDHKYDETKK